MVENYPFAITAMAYWGTGLPNTAGVSGGGWYSLEDGKSDNGSPIALRWQTGAFDQGLPDFYKWYSDIEIEAWMASGNCTLTVEAIFDSGEDGRLARHGLRSRTRPSRRLPSGCRRIPRFLCLPAEAGFRLSGAELCHQGNRQRLGRGDLRRPVSASLYPEERVAHTFDSGPTAFGLPEKVKQVDYLEFYATGTGQSLQRTLRIERPPGARADHPRSGGDAGAERPRRC